MADSPRGRRLTENHRVAQLGVRAAFLEEFMSLWPLLDVNRLDDTAEPWIDTVMPVIARYREDSAALTERYYQDFKQAEQPSSALERPVQPIPREAPAQSRRPRQRGRQTADPPPPRRGQLVTPRIIWDEEDKAAQVSLLVTGPVNVKSKRKRGKSPEESAREALVEAGGSASRHVLTGGRRTHLELLNEDADAIGYIRVTDGDPCHFCAMLSGRGPVYRSERSAATVVRGRKRAIGDTYHDNCACTAEAVYSKSQAWPGRGREFQQLWRDTTKGYSGQDAINAFRRAYEKRIREAEREIETA